jgi:hypothetical protein
MAPRARAAALALLPLLLSLARGCGVVAPPALLNACPRRRAYAPLPHALRPRPSFPSGGSLVEAGGDE